jgi:hypothetical protein
MIFLKKKKRKKKNIEIIKKLKELKIKIKRKIRGAARSTQCQPTPVPKEWSSGSSDDKTVFHERDGWREVIRDGNRILILDRRISSLWLGFVLKNP